MELPCRINLWYALLIHAPISNKILNLMTSSKWKHFPRYWPFVWGIHRSPVNSYPQRPVTRSFDIFLICAPTNGWANNRDAGDLRRHRAHYEIIVMNCRLAMLLHDCVIKWKHFPRYWPFVWGIHRSPEGLVLLMIWIHIQSYEHTCVM